MTELQSKKYEDSNVTSILKINFAYFPNLEQHDNCKPKIKSVDPNEANDSALSKMIHQFASDQRQKQQQQQQ